MLRNSGSAGTILSLLSVYLIYVGRRLSRPRALPVGTSRWRVALTLSFVAYLSGLGFLGLLASALSHVVGAADWFSATAYFVAGAASGVIALWHGPVLRLRRGRVLLAIAASGTYLLWALITVPTPQWLPSLANAIYRHVFVLLAPGVLGAALVALWQQPPVRGAANATPGPPRAADLPDPATERRDLQKL